MRLRIFPGGFIGAALALLTLSAVLLLAVFVNPLRPQGGGRDLKDLGLTDFVQTEMSYDGVMHELYWHYEFANQMIRVGRVEDAKAHLRMISFYVNLLPYLTREKDKQFFRDATTTKKFDQYAQDLLSIVDQMGRSLGSGSTDAAGKEMQKRVDYLCYHCHKDLKKTPIREITPYGKKIEMGPATGAPKEGRKRVHQ